METLKMDSETHIYDILSHKIVSHRVGMTSLDVNHKFEKILIGEVMKL